MKKHIMFSLFVIVATVAMAQTKQDDIKKLLNVSGSRSVATQIIDAIIPSFKKIAPNVPENVWEQFYSEFNADEFVDLYIPIYDKYYTQDEIVELIKFYESDIGKKMVNLIPQITHDSMLIGQWYGQVLGERILNRLKEDGYINT